MKRLLEGDATPMERTLLESADLDAPEMTGPSPSERLLDRAASEARAEATTRRTTRVVRYAAIAVAAAVLAFVAYRVRREPGLATQPIAPAPERATAVPAAPDSVAIPPPPDPPPSASATPADRWFDKGVVAHALYKVDVQSCAQPNQPKGEGHVVIDFKRDGTVASAKIDRGPFTRPVATCIIAKFKAVTIPPFENDPIQMGRTFTIE